MLSIAEVYELFDKVGCCSFATLDGKGGVDSRIAHFFAHDENGLYLRTMTGKPFYRQMIEGGKLSVCGEVTAAPCEWDEDNMPHFQPGYMVRVSGDVRELSAEETDQLIKTNPGAAPRSLHQVFASPMIVRNAVYAKRHVRIKPSYQEARIAFWANAVTSAAIAITYANSTRSWRSRKRIMVNSATIKSPAEQKAPEASSTTNTAEGSFVNMLSQTLTAANAYLVSLLSQAGLKDLVPSHGDILVALFAQETITMQELSEKIHRDPSTITALVKKLVLGGYVQTQKSVTDKRRTEVSLTPKGKSLRSTFETISTTLVNTQMEGIDADAFAITCATLNQIRANFIAANQKEETSSQ